MAESQKQSQAKEEVKANTSGAPGFTRATTSPVTTAARPLPPGLTRIGSTATPQPAAAAPNESLETLVSDADRGMIRGKVQIISDERSNQLIIITRNENMNFFDKIITVLDVETLPDVMVEVQRLKYADAEEVSTMLNDLIGNVSSKKDDKAPAGAAKAAAPAAAGEPAKSTTLAEAVAARTGRTEASAGDAGGKSKLGQLSKDNIKILADKRTNALVMMGSPSDLKAVKEIIEGMDIQLSQVLIETVVLEVNLSDEIETGIDWVKRVNQNSRYADGIGGGGGGATPVNLLSGDLENAALAAGKGLNYFSTIKGLDLDIVIKAAANDSRSTVLSSPVLLTVDNKEATIESTEMRYLLKGFRYSGSTYQGSGQEVPDYEQRDFGLTVKVTPRINPNGTVVMQIEKTYETEGDKQSIQTGTSDDGNAVFSDLPKINTRKIQAEVSVDNRETVVLGGLVKKNTSFSKGGVPFLRDIPYIGPYLFGKTSKSEGRTELLVFLTPYVLDNRAMVEAEMRRRKDALSLDGVWAQGWSESKLADPSTKQEALRRQKQKWEAEDREYDAVEKYEEEVRARAQKLLKREQSEGRKTPRKEAGESGQSATFGILEAVETTEVVKPAEALGPGALLPPAGGAR